MGNNLVIINANIFTPQGKTARKGKEMDELLTIPLGTVEVTEGIITYVGESRTCDPKPEYLTVNAEGKALLPGFIDSHTHLVFGGFRNDEFIWRLNGDNYMNIMKRGGGIFSTVNATRQTPFQNLKDKAQGFIDIMSCMGITTVEAKSGYGLDIETELKQLKVMQAINNDPDRKVDIVPTFLGAHAVPKEFWGKSRGYLDFLIYSMLPKVREMQLAENCDVFCEKGVFTVAQSRRLLKAAQKLGFGIKIHADEMTCSGGAKLAVELNALSADHLLHVSKKGIEALAQSDVVATLLPLTAFSLGKPYARGREIIDSGCAVALATDLNPGSALSGSIPLLFALACIHMKMTVNEVITALTLNAAAAIGHANQLGNIETCKQGDFTLLNLGSPDIIPYYIGINHVKTTIKAGRIMSTGIRLNPTEVDDNDDDDDDDY